MTATKHTLMSRLAPLIVPIVVLVGVLSAFTAEAHAAKSAPVKLVLNEQGFIGAGIREFTGESCGQNTGAECQIGEESSAPGGFAYPEDVAAAPDGDIYVADKGNNRVQELDPSMPAGKQFVLMFGKDVNTNGSSVCTAAEESKCKAGVSGAAADAFDLPQDLAVEPGTDDVYVYDYFNARVEKYTATGKFLLMLGKDVNINGSNLCTNAEEANCKVGVEGALESTEADALDIEGIQGDLLAVGGTKEHEHILYVGSAHRVLELGPQGEPLGEIKLSSEIIDSAPERLITSIATNGETVFVVYDHQDVVHDLNAVTGTESGHILVAPPVVGEKWLGSAEIHALATNAAGDLAIAAAQATLEEDGSPRLQFGSLYVAASGEYLTGFTVPGRQNSLGVPSLSFSATGDLYAVTFGQDIMSYAPRPVAEVLTLSQECSVGAERDTDVTYDCKLNGEVDPWGVAGTTAEFQSGRSESLGQSTPPVAVANAHVPPVEGEEEPYVPLSASIEGVRPGEVSFYRLAGSDRNLGVTESLLSGKTLSFATPLAAPKVIGAPSSLFVGATSAVLFGELNPENASTVYAFQYAPAAGCEALEALEGRQVSLGECPGVQETVSQVSAAYTRMGTTAEVSDLPSATTYRYGLRAQSAAGTAGSVVDGVLRTLPTPVVQAVTGASGAVTSSSVVVAGAVDPDGQIATYTFELGVANGAGTEYDLVASGSVEAATGLVPESVAVSGLQPGTTYAYRVGVHYGDGSTAGSSAVGAPQVFTTAGLATVLESPPSQALLALPAGIRFPASPKAAVSTKQLTSAQKLAKALKSCRKKPKRKRASCERQARKLYEGKRKHSQ